MKRILHFLNPGERVDATTPPPLFLKIRSSKLFIVFTVCLAIFTDIFLYGIIVPVLPFSLTDRVGTPEKDTQKWVSVLLAVYGGSVTLGSPLIGWYADKSPSRRWPLLCGLVFLGASTVMLCLSRTIALLVVGRLLQGISAAIVWTVGLALLVDTVGRAEVGQMLGYAGVSMTLGLLAAPLLGGVVYDQAGYYPVFYMAFGLIILDIFLRLVLIEKKIAAQWLDESSTPTTSNPPSSNEAEKSDGIESIPNETSSPDTSVSPQYAPSKYPAIITLLSSPRIWAALWACLIQGSLTTAFDSVVPLFVHKTFGWGSTASGLCFLALVLPTLLSPVVGWISDNHGPRWFAVAGFVLAVPFWILLRLVTYDSLGQKVLFLALLALIGVSLTLALPVMMAEITYIIEAKERERPGRYGPKGAYAQGYGLFVTFFSAGNVVGPLWGGYVNDKAGWNTMTISLAFFSLTGAVPCLIWTGGLITQANAKSAEERDTGKAAQEDIIPGEKV